MHTEKTRAPDSAACLHKRRRTRDEWVECQRSWKLVADVAALSIACACERSGIEKSATQLFWVVKQKRTQKSAGALPLSGFLLSAWVIQQTQNVGYALILIFVIVCMPNKCALSLYLLLWSCGLFFVPAFHFAFTFGFSICMLQQLRALR